VLRRPPFSVSLLLILNEITRVRIYPEFVSNLKKAAAMRFSILPVARISLCGCQIGHPEAGVSGSKLTNTELHRRQHSRHRRAQAKPLESAVKEVADILARIILVVHKSEPGPAPAFVVTLIP
jgi:hypothetical protein